MNIFKWIARLISFKAFNVNAIQQGPSEKQSPRNPSKVALHASENHLRDLLDNITYISLILNADGKVTYCNSFLLNLTGYTQKELYGSDWFERMVPDDSLEIKEEFLKGMSGGQIAVHCESPILTKSGKLRHVSWNKTILRNPSGTIIGIASIGDDITEHKQSEKALIESENHFKLLFENAPLSYQSLDQNAGIINVNPQWLITLGYQRDEVIDHYFGDFMTSESEKHLKEKYANFVKAGEIHDCQFELIRKDGSQIIVSFDGKIGYDELGQFKQTHCIFQDVTERRKIEDALIKEKILLQTLIDNLPSGVFVKDKKYRKINGNTIHKVSVARHLASLGLDPETEIIGKTDFDIYPKELAEQYFIDDQKILNDGISIINKEELGIDPDGKAVLLLVSKIPIHNEDGSIDGMVGITTDITGLKLAETKLRESEANLRKSQAIAKLGSWIYYLNGKISWSEETYDIYGVMPESFSPDHESFFKLIHPDDQNLMQAWINDCIAEKRPEEIEFRCILPSGKIRYISGRGEMIYDAQNRPLHIAGTVQDITEHKLMENLLRASELKYRNIFENVQDVFYQIDEHENISDISPSIFRLSGFTREELRGTPVTSFYYDSKERDKLMDLISQKGEVWDFEVRLRTKSGQVKYVSLNAHKLFNSENIQIGIEGSLRDINERKLIEIELIAAKEKAEESDHLKTAFLHNISHEIRTPMNAIMGFSETLNTPNLLPEKRKFFTEIIIQSSNQLLSIISDIIRIATIEAGQEKINETVINLNSTCKLLYQQFLVKAKKQNVSLSLNTALPDDEAFLKTDETKLIEILTNLIGNALKFTKEGTVDIGYKIIENTLEFFVKDTGLGIPPEIHEEIFKRFRQAETTTARRYGGSGLGLSISKAYVDLLGGKIWLTSEPDKGSKFYFTVPYKKVNQMDLSNKLPSKELNIDLKKTITILIAEDEDSNYLLLEELLAENKIKLIRALNGLEAVNICKSNPHIDLVLMDMKMPEMDGYEATRQIKEFLPNLPVIGQTAYSSEMDKNKVLACGCSDYISKPIDNQLLKNIIQKHLR